MGVEEEVEVAEPDVVQVVAAVVGVEISPLNVRFRVFF